MEAEELHLSVKDRILISPAGQWAAQHRNLLINIGTVVLVLLVWGLIKAARTPNVDAFRRAQEAYAAWKAKPDDEDLYQLLEKSLAKAPAAKRVLGGEIAQSLLIAGRIDAAEEMAKESIWELRTIAPHYAEFSEISLLIKRKHYQEALEKSVSLKERLLDKTELYCQNLIRIAFLHQQLGNEAGELSAWRDLEQSGRTDLAALGFSIKAFKALPVHFTSYVEERKNLLELR